MAIGKNGLVAYGSTVVAIGTLAFSAISTWKEIEPITFSYWPLVVLAILVVATPALFLDLLFREAVAARPSPPTTPLNPSDPHEEYGYLIRDAVPGDANGVHKVAMGCFPQDTLLSVSEIKRWMGRGRGIFRVLVQFDTSREERGIVGYYALFPLSRARYEELKSHKISEQDIRLEDFAPTTGTRMQAIYILDIAVLEAYRGVPSRGLQADGVRYLAELVKRNPNLEVVGAWGFRIGGEKIARKLGFKYLFQYPGVDEGAFYEIERPHRHFSPDSENDAVADSLAAPFQKVNVVSQADDVLAPPG